jgi:CBS domain-containing protein
MPLQSSRTIPTDAFRMTVFVVFLCTAFVPSRASADSESQPRTTITFAQLSDAHLFDDGWNLATADALRQAADDRVSLRWAIERINYLVASGIPIDFVVYTGDFGLQNVDFPADGACKLLQPKVEPGLPMVPLRWALNEVVTELNQLVVRKLFVLAGNNDIVDENVLDTRRFDCFLSELQMAGRRYSPPLQISGLNADSVVAINGIRLAGLNTASFKKLLNYDQACSNPPAPADAGMLREACPGSQMTLLQQFNAARPLVLFTHVPDLKDPYRKIASWEIQPKVRQLWEEQICGPSVVAVFAGHFHDTKRTIYATTTGTRDLAVSECVAGRVWVAPPLAAKNQVGKSPQARGFLLATVAVTGVQEAQAIWYEPSVATHSHRHPHLVLAIGFVSFSFLAIGYLILVGRLNLSDKYRDLTAVIVVSMFLEYAVVAMWLAKNKVGIADSVTLVALLVIPLLLYGIVSGRLTEFSGPGGWGAKFREAARQAVDTSLHPIDLKASQQIVPIAKEHYSDLQEKIRHGDIQEGKAVILTMKTGKMGESTYDASSLEDYLRDLSHFPSFKFVIIVDDRNQLVAYILARFLKRANDLALPDFKELINAVNNGDRDALLRIQGVLTETISPRTTNADALRTMEKYGLDAIPVVEESTKQVRAIVDRDRILSHMLLVLTGADKA